MQAEAEAQLDRLSQLDAARAELLAVVTHELRTPLAIVRAYLDLLADAAAANAAGPAVETVEDWRGAVTEQVTRLDRLVDSILASVRGEGLQGLRREPFDVAAAIATTVGSLSLLLRRPAGPLGPAAPVPSTGIGDEARFRQVLEHLLDNEAEVRAARARRLPRRVARGRRASACTSPMTARACRSRTGRRCSSRTSAWTGRDPAGPGSGCSLHAG